jgi:hypothetical protein
MKNDDLIIYKKDNREIIAIIPIIRGDRPTVLKKGYMSVIKKCDERNILGDGKHIYLAE